MSSIVLLNISLRPVFEKVRYAYSEPLDCLSIIAYAKQHGISIAFKDMQLAFKGTVGSMELGDAWESLCISAREALAIYCDPMTLPLAIVLSQYHKVRYPASRVILLGPSASCVAKLIIDCFPFIDYVIEGEMEISFLKIVYNNRNKTKPVGRYIERGVVCSPLCSIDKLPFPEREPAPDAEYCISILASRGCPSGCNYCTSRRIWGNTHRVRKPTSVISELEHIFACIIEGKIQRNMHISFMDDDIAYDPEWLRRLDLLYEEKGVYSGDNGKSMLPFSCFSSVDTIDNKTIALLEKMGCKHIRLCINYNQLRGALKELYTAQIIKCCTGVLDRINSVSIRFLYGFPYVSPEEVEQLMVLKTKLDSLGVVTLVTRLNPIYGSPLTTAYHGEFTLNETLMYLWLDSLFLDSKTNNAMMDLVRENRDIFLSYYDYADALIPAKESIISGYVGTAVSEVT